MKNIVEKALKKEDKLKKKSSVQKTTSKVKEITKKKEIKNTMPLNSSGKNNPMYGISPKERMDEDTYNQWLLKKKESSKGNKNPNYHNDTLRKKLLEYPELKKEYYSRPGGQNGRAQKILTSLAVTGDIASPYINTKW